MADEEWMRPSEALKKMAEGTNTPQLRECRSCKHRHPQGDLCGYPRNPEFGDRNQSLFCECRR